MLDVGCGSHSPSITRKWMPACSYYGIDRQNYGNDEDDFDVMEKYYELDLERDTLDSVPDEFFDIVIMSHVIEHLSNGLEVITALARKVRPGGHFYLETPSERSLRLPSMKGTLNFFDDETHVRVYGVGEMEKALVDGGFRVVRSGTRRDWIRIVLLPAIVPVKYALRRELSAGDFWDVAGFASYVAAVKA